MSADTLIPEYGKEEVTDLINKWKGILNLQEWKIVSCVLPKLSEKECAATVVWDFANKAAVICILNHKSATKLSEEYVDQFDLEETIVHELLHPFFAVYSSDLKVHLHGRFDLCLTLMARVLMNLHNK